MRRLEQLLEQQRTPTFRVADESVIGRLRNKVSELEHRFQYASILCMHVADSQYKASSCRLLQEAYPTSMVKSAGSIGMTLSTKK